MTEFVRVRLENGSEASVTAEYAELVGLEPLKKDGSRNGEALEAKYNPLKKSTPANPKENS